MKSKIELTIIALFATIISQAFSLPIRSINGSDNVTPGSTEGYYYNAVSVLSSPDWEVTGGTIISTSVDGGTQYSVNIHWGSAGTGSVALKNGTATIDTKSVTISVTASAFVGGGGDYCSGQTINVKVYNSVSGRSYQLYVDFHPILTAKLGTGGTISWTVTMGGSYTSIASPGGAVSGSATVVIDPGPTVSYVVGGLPYCGGSRTIVLADSDPPSVGSSYFLRRDGAIVGSSVAGTGEALSWTGLTTPGIYTVTAQSGDGCPSTMTGTRVISPIPSAPPAISTKDRCDAGVVTLTGAAGANGDILKWYSASSGGELLTSVPSLCFTPSQTLTTTYYASTYNSVNGCESETRTPATALIKYSPQIEAIDQRDICTGESINISLEDSNNTPGTTFTWTYSGANITGGSNGSGSIINQTLTRTGTAALASAKYTVTPIGSNGCVGVPVVKSFNVKLSQISCVDMNYVVSHTVLTDNIINPDDVEFLPDSSLSQTIQYLDGLGRPVQSVTKHGSPAKNDIVQPVSYDPYGREQYKYLPFVQGTTGRYNGDFIAKEDDDYSTSSNPQFQFYQGTTAVPTDTVPYSTVIFEASPLNRPLATYSPGQKWAEQDKKLTYSYPINIHGTGNSGGQEKIIVWKVDASTVSLTRTDLNDGYYPTGSLTIKSTTDEQGHEVREYTNKEGQVILKKVYVTGSTSDFNTPGNWAETYYVYDDLGNLSFVLPPEAVVRLTEND